MSSSDVLADPSLTSFDLASQVYRLAIQKGLSREEAGNLTAAYFGIGSATESHNWSWRWQEVAHLLEVRHRHAQGDFEEPTEPSADPLLSDLPVDEDECGR